MKVILLVTVLILGVTCFPERRQTECNSFCPMYMVQFCGSDGKTYTSNECFIKSKMCRNGENGYGSFKTLHMGPCTGDELTTTGAEQRRQSQCGGICPMYMIEFCGSDGKTYNSNECFIKSQWCNEGRNDFGSFKQLHYGACTGKELMNNTTADVKVPEKRQSHCNSFCPMYIIELCGSDGKTYHSNECFLKSQFCNEGRNDFDSFKSLHYGACTGDELVQTKAPAVAVPEKRQFSSNCNTFCPMYVVEFCGSDGQTYNSNECFLKSQWCNEGRNGFEDFKTLHLGACTGDELTQSTTTGTAA